jgi:hypothetical protein
MCCLPSLETRAANVKFDTNGEVFSDNAPYTVPLPLCAKVKVQPHARVVMFDRDGINLGTRLWSARAPTPSCGQPNVCAFLDAVIETSDELHHIPKKIYVHPHPEQMLPFRWHTCPEWAGSSVLPKIPVSAGMGRANQL